MSVDLWLRQPKGYLAEALEEGFRQFSWHVPALYKSRTEVLSWLRAHSLGYGDNIKLRLIDYHGCAEYTIFSNYDSPTAVYPTWAAEDEPWEQLEWLIKNPVGENVEFCTTEDVPKNMRPVLGQRHVIAIHRLPPPGIQQSLLALRLRELQLDNPQVELFISGFRQFNSLFGMDFKAVDWMPLQMTPTGGVYELVILPTGKMLTREHIWDPRYRDWFELLGFDQLETVTRDELTQFTLRSAMWAWRNWDRVVPFVTKKAFVRDYVKEHPDFIKVDDRSFVLPAARRKLMRSLGLKAGEYDMFTCDTCILHNVCTLYRENSVCTVKGSDAVPLADSFGSRNVDVLIGGLSEVLRRQAERLEDSMAAEEAAGDGLDPEVTKLSKTVFDQGVKLAKLMDPGRFAGPKVNVNVGVGSGGNASVAVSTDPRQMVAGIVAELEAQGIPREKITSDMIKGVLEGAAHAGAKRAVEAAKIVHDDESKTIEGSVT